jgi:hypothetical protein
VFSIRGSCAFQRIVHPKKLWVKGRISPLHEGRKLGGGGRGGFLREPEV